MTLFDSDKSEDHNWIPANLICPGNTGSVARRSRQCHLHVVITKAGGLVDNGHQAAGHWNAPVVPPEPYLGDRVYLTAYGGK